MPYRKYARFFHTWNLKSQLSTENEWINDESLPWILFRETVEEKLNSEYLVLNTICVSTF